MSQHKKNHMVFALVEIDVIAAVALLLVYEGISFLLSRYPVQ